MKEIIGTIQRDKKFDYVIDKNGNIIKRKYNILRDPYTLVTIALLVLGGMYYLQMKQSITNADNFDRYCVLYTHMRDDYVLNNPLQEVTFKKVLEYSKTKNLSLNDFPNISGGRGNG